MILGQLYYYNGQLNTILRPEDLTQWHGVELAGIGLVDGYIKGDDADEFRSRLRVTFLAAYGDYLKEYDEVMAAEVWQQLVSPRISSSDELEVSGFAGVVIQWAQSGLPYNELSNLVETGSLYPDQTSYALYYGLRVLELVSRPPTQTGHFIHSFPDGGLVGEEMDTVPTMLVVCSIETAPLYAHIGMVWVELIHGELIEELYSRIHVVLSSNASIQTVLIEDGSDEATRMLETLIQRHLDTADVVCAPIRLNNDFRGSFFDAIVKETLGVKLV